MNLIPDWTKYLLPHPTPFWEFWNSGEEYIYPFVSLCTIYNEEGLIKPELLVAKPGINYEDAIKHLELVLVPNSWILHKEVGIRAGSYLIALWFTPESVHYELKRLLGDKSG
jgi:hypothetical protein